MCMVADLINLLEPSDSFLAFSREELVNFFAFSRDEDVNFRDWVLKRFTFFREEAARRRASSRIRGKSGTGEEGDDQECSCILH